MRTPIAIVLALAAFSAGAQVQHRRAWLEGTITTDLGTPPWDWPDYRGAVVTLRPTSGKDLTTLIELDKGGYYCFRNIRPGIYDLFVSRSFAKVDGKWAPYRPQVVRHLRLRPNRRTPFNLRVGPGQELQDLGTWNDKPTPTPPVKP